MNHRRLPLILSLMSLAVLSFVFRESAPAAIPWKTKVDPWIMDNAARGETEFLIFLVEQADLSQAASLGSKLEKGKYVYEQLTRVAQRTQAPILGELRKRGVPHRSFWVANMIWARGSASLVEELARREDVAHLYANPSVKQQLPQTSVSAADISPATPATIEWNISHVRAPLVWAEGFSGQGAVVAGQDTGYRWDHPALIEHYGGWNGSTADHNYNWHDAIHENNPHSPPGNACGYNVPVPCDDHGHGTHTMGTMVGDDGAGNQIGMSPGAKWIGCRNMEEGWGTPATYSECYEWFMAPTDQNGENPRPDLAPDVINNSWGCPPVEGCTDPNELLFVVEAVRAAGILTVHSAGNYGPSCGTVRDPAAIYDASFTVGNTNRWDLLNYQSSRGPVVSDGSFRLKPDITAPGTAIRSSYITPYDYLTLDGTSMAGPHVAGLAALLISARPELAGRVDLLEEVIRRSAVPLTSDESCGDVPGYAVPNNSFGWGRIDAYAAYLRLLNILFPYLIYTP